MHQLLSIRTVLNTLLIAYCTVFGVQCRSPQVVLKKWYEPQIDSTHQQTLQNVILDDEDFCISVEKKGHIDTLYLPYKQWKTIQRGDTIRLAPRRYRADWRVSDLPKAGTQQ